LTGLTACAVCGGSFCVRKRPNGKNPDTTPLAYYVCFYYHARGKTICPNNLPLRMEHADDAVLNLLRDDILDPEVIARGIEKAIGAYQERSGDPIVQRTTVEGELRKVEGEIERLVGALAGGQHWTRSRPG